jgi:hypothetical protein
MIKNEKDELSKNLSRAKEIAKNFIDIGKEYQKEGQRLFDDATTTEDLINLPIESIDYQTQNLLWGGTVTMANLKLEQQTKIPPYVTSSGSPMMNLYITIPDIKAEIINFSFDYQKKANSAMTNFVQHIETTFSKESTINALHKYKLDKGFGTDRSPLELFEIGYAAFEAPVSSDNPAVTSIIPIRGCIDSMVAELLRRRITQEPTSNEINKIISIEKQLKFENISEELGISLGNEYHDLSDLLSKTKLSKTERYQWRNLIQRSMNFINGFLETLDAQKMRIK